VDEQSLSDADIHRSVEATLLGVLLPAIPDDEQWARAAAIQLAGLARYAAGRGPDRTSPRVREVADVLNSLARNELVASAWNGDESAGVVMAAAGAVLAGAVGRDDDAARQVRNVLRPILVRQLDDELDETAPMVDAFRGKLDG
jgi:hypothetical protein